MSHLSFPIVVVLALCFLGIFSPVFINPAEGVSIETFHEEFRLNTGKEWIDATEEEKRSFVQDYYRRKEEAIREGKERLYDDGGDGGSPSPFNIESILDVRQRFERKEKKVWEEATSEEQKAFMGEYKKEKEKERWLQKQQEARIARAEQKERRRKEAERMRLERLKAQKARQEVKEARQREKEREESREKLEDELKRLEKLQKRK